MRRRQRGCANDWTLSAVASGGGRGGGAAGSAATSQRVESFVTRGESVKGKPFLFRRKRASKRDVAASEKRTEAQPVVRVMART